MMAALQKIQTFTILIFLLCLAASLCLAGEVFSGLVVKVSDGDTIEVLRQGKAVKIRLAGIDFS